ncbi:MAG: hypothetical protein M5U28_31185 [Sandaracinaceae bacterium]|nr:hypothetical protein [Sandaracinaceae bacterium]
MTICVAGSKSVSESYEVGGMSKSAIIEACTIGKTRVVSFTIV